MIRGVLPAGLAGEGRLPRRGPPQQLCDGPSQARRPGGHAGLGPRPGARPPAFVGLRRGGVPAEESPGRHRSDDPELPLGLPLRDRPVDARIALRVPRADGVAADAPAWLLGAIVAGCLVHLGIGSYLRVLEAERTIVTREIMEGYARYREQERRDRPAFEPNATIAGDPEFVNFAVVRENLRPLEHFSALVTPSLTDREWNLRIALNAFLRNRPRGVSVPSSENAFRYIIMKQAGWGAGFGPLEPRPASPRDAAEGTVRGFRRDREGPRAVPRSLRRPLRGPADRTPGRLSSTPDGSRSDPARRGTSARRAWPG